MSGGAVGRWAAIVADLNVPNPFHLGEFLERLAARRQRMIYLHPFESGLGVPCGLWIGTAKADHIFHEQRTTPWHQTQIAMHEIAHMVLGHGSGPQVPDGLTRLLAPDVDPALVRILLDHGSSYCMAEEQEAEALASFILAQSTAT